jgi:hypothetical protein
MLVSTLAQKERKTLGRDITILQLQRRDSSYRRNSEDLVWRDAGKSGKFDANRTFYYVPLTGFVMTSKYNWLRSASGLGEILKSCSIGELNNITVYGVRKADIEAIESKKNWVNLEDHIVAVLKKFKTEIFDTLLAKSLDRYEFLRYNKQNNEVLEKLTDQNGHYATVLGQVARLKTVKYLDTGALQALLSGYGEDLATDINKGKAKLEAECNKCYQLYPLLEMLEHSVDRSSFDSSRFAAYINMIDSQKKDI